MLTLGTNVAIVASGRVLLIRHSWYGVWCLPGGTVEPGESVAEAAVREAREETGLEVELTRLVGVFSLPEWKGGGNHVARFSETRTMSRSTPATSTRADSPTMWSGGTARA